MRTVVRVISVFALFVHAGLGCCAHHGHAGESACCAVSGSVQTPQCASTLQHDHATEHDDAPACGQALERAPEVAHQHDDRGDQRSPAGDGCDGFRCFGILAVKTACPGLTWDVFEAFLFAPQPKVSGQDRIRSDLLLADSFAPPVRRHLAHRVLLI